MTPDPIAPAEESVAQPAMHENHGGLTPPARPDDQPVVNLAPGRKLAAAGGGSHVFRFGMRTFLIGSVLFSLQFLAWNLLGILYGSLVNVSLILIVSVAAIAWGAVAGARDPNKDRFWDQAVVRGMLAFYLMAATAFLAGGGKMINDFVQTRRIRYVVEERYGFTGSEHLALDDGQAVTLVAVDDVDPNGPFAQAGIAPGQAVVVSGPIEDFYDRLLAPDVDAITVTVVKAPADSSVAADITRSPARTARLKLQAD